MTEKQVLEKIEKGDGVLLAKILSTDEKPISRANALQMLRRQNSKRHDEAVSALLSIVTNRENLINKN